MTVVPDRETGAATTSIKGVDRVLPTTVYVLWHIRDDDDTHAKLIGVFSSRSKASEAQATTVTLEGFRDFPDDFMVDEVEVDALGWRTGFVILEE